MLARIQMAAESSGNRLDADQSTDGLDIHLIRFDTVDVPLEIDYLLLIVIPVQESQVACRPDRSIR